MIRGQTNNIALMPQGHKDTDPIDTFGPRQIDLRNGRLTEQGSWTKRPGYATQWTLSADRTINGLIPDTNAYALTSAGETWRITPDGTVTQRTGFDRNGTYRPTWVRHNSNIIICDGGVATKIAVGASDTSRLDNAPTDARFVDTVDTYLVMAGMASNPKQFQWSTPSTASSEAWPAANIQSVTGDGEHIEFFKVFRRDLYFFKTHSLEIWVNIGGASVFARKLYIEKGCGAPYSVVQANDTFYWFGDDGDFYVLNGVQPQVISRSYRKELDAITDTASIYGFDCRAESVIRWFAPTEGKCFTYDYKYNVFSEDNIWASGQWERLPMNAYMEWNGKQYFGDFNLTGTIYQWSLDYEDDNGTPIRVFRRVLHPIIQGEQGRVNRLQFRVKRGVATTAVTNPQMLVRWRFDQGDYTPYQQIDLGVVADRNPYRDLFSLGVGREIEVEMVETDAVPHVITHASITAEALG